MIELQLIPQRQILHTCNNSDDHLISQHFNPEWPARSPDLTPFGSSIFERLKDIVYKQRLQNVKELMHEITHCCEDISEVMLQNILENKKGRVLLRLQ
jgi:hypothetical protein